MSHRALLRSLFALVCAFACAFAVADPAMRIETSSRQPDGKILFAGQVPGSSPRQLIIGRLNADGSYDASFIGAGWFTYAADPAVGEFRATAIATQPDDGKIVLALVQDGMTALLRLDSAGSPDPAFGYSGNGLAVDPASAAEHVNALVAQTGFGLIAVGAQQGGGTWQSALVHYWPDGSRDLYWGYGANGAKVPMLAGGDNELRAVVVDPAGKIFAAGYARQSPGSDKDYLTASFWPNGELDSGFAINGRDIAAPFGTHDDEAFTIAFDNDGNLVVGGQGDARRFTILRYYANGMRNTTPPGFVYFSNFWIDGYLDTTSAIYSISPIPGSSDLLLAGTAIETYTGRAYFAFDRIGPYYYDFQLVGPITGNDDLLVAAYANADGEFVAVGTRETAQGDFARRARYFLEPLQFDTDFPTEGADSTPNPFSFDSGSAVGPLFDAYSNGVRITGINVPTPISIQGGAYSIGCDYGAFTAAPGTIVNGQTVCVMQTSAGTPFTTTVATLTIGDISGAYSISTGGVPDTIINSGPANPTTGTSAQFSYGSDWWYAGSASAIECRLDSAAFAACPYTNPMYSNLAPGTHTFEVRASNSWGTDATPASYTWTILGVPDTSIDSGPPPTTNQTTATFTFSSTQPQSTFQCQLDGAAFAGCTSPKTYAALADGSHTFQVKASTAAGTDATPAAYTWTIDASPPDTTLTNIYGSSIGTDWVRFEFTSNDAGATFQCSLDGAPYAACTSPVIATGLANGQHTFLVRAVDAVGNVDNTPAARTVSIDTTAPQTAITGGPSDPSNVSTATFYIGPFGGSIAYQCKMDGVALSVCTSPQSFGGLRDGAHSFEATARRLTFDGAGNILWLADPTPEVRTWVVDLPPPETSVYGPTGSTRSTSAQITFSSDNYPVTFECALDGAPWSACSGEVDPANLAEGAHTFLVRASTATKTDPTPAALNWVVDLTPPVGTVISGPQSTTSSTTATFEFASNESGSTFWCGLDTGNLSPCTSPKTYTGIAAGSHYFVALPVDAAGNNALTGAYWYWTIDLTAPETTLTSAPSGTVAQSSATFQFASDDAGASFECSLDAAPFATCSSPVTLSALVDGGHAFAVRARDAAGNADASPATATWTIDTTAPDTSITAGPSGTVAQASATFAFESPEPTATFQCALDGAAFVACTSPTAYTGLADGMHMFEVRAVDSLGNTDASPASRTWAVDTTSPNTTITSGPSAVTSNTAATIAFTSSEAGGFMCSLDGAAYTACASPQTFAALAAGSHAFSVYAIDAVGNTDASAATWSWFIDITAPETTITSAPAGTVASSTASLSFTSDDPAAVFECALDGAGFTPCSSPFTVNGLADGAHGFQVRARDSAGNADATPATAAWSVDTTAPETTITASPPSVTNNTSASFSFASGDAGASFECKLDTGGFAACSSPKAYSGLANGTHTFSVRARDAVGNVDGTPATANWTVDTVAPDTTITSGPNGNNNAQPVTFAFTSTESGSTFECRMDAAAFAACTSPQSYSGLAKGQHTFQVRAKDAAGNVDATPASRNFGVR